MAASFSELPAELLALVIKELDSHSIRSLLFALPGLRKHTIVVIDAFSPSTSPEFFTIPGVPIAKSPEGRTALIKLYEVDLRRTIAAARWLLMETITLDPFTYVYAVGDITQRVAVRSHISEYDDDIVVMDRCFFTVSESFQDYTCSMKQEGKTYPWSDMKLYPYFESDLHTDSHVRGTVIYDSLSQKSSFSELTSLTLEIPYSDTIPRIHGLQAPKLEFFKVHYGGRLPLLYDLDGLGYAGANKYGHEGHFELVNCTASKSQFTSAPLVDNMTYEKDYEVMDLSSLVAHFKNLSFSGTPEFVIDRLPHEELHGLTWCRTVKYTGDGCSPGNNHMRGPPLNLCNLLSFSFMTNLPNTTIRWVNFNKLVDFKVLTLAPNLFLEDRYDLSTLITLESFTMICHLEKEATSGHLIVTLHDLFVVGHSPYLNRIVIEGCTFGAGNIFLNDAITWLDRRWYKSERRALNSIDTIKVCLLTHTSSFPSDFC